MGGMFRSNRFFDHVRLRSVSRFLTVLLLVLHLLLFLSIIAELHLDLLVLNVVLIRSHLIGCQYIIRTKSDELYRMRHSF